MKKTFFLLFYVINSFGQPSIRTIIEPASVSVKNIKVKFSQFKQNEPSDFYNYSNKLAKPFQDYQYVGSFVNGIAPAIIEKKCVYIDTLGKVVFKTKFDKGSNFKNNYAQVVLGRKSGIINNSGQWIIKRKKKKIVSYNDHYVLFEKDSVTELLNYQGKTISSAKNIESSGYLLYYRNEKGLKIFDHLGNELPTFYKSFAYLSPNFYHYETQEKQGILNNEFEEITSFDGLRETQSAYLVEKNDSIRYLIKDKKWAIFHIEKGLLTGYQFNHVALLKKKYFVVQSGATKALLSPECKPLSNFTYEYIQSTQSDKWLSVYGEYKNKNLIDYQGKAFLNPELAISGYTKCEVVNDSLFIVEKDNKSGLINDKQEIIAPIIYHDIKPFKNGFGWASKKEVVDGKTVLLESGFLNEKGTYKSAKTYGYSGVNFFKGFAIVENKDFRSVIDSTFTTIIPFEAKLSRISGPEEGIFIARKDYKYGYIDSKGKNITGFDFHDAFPFRNGLALVNGNSYINTKGKIVYQNVKITNEIKYVDGIARVQFNEKWGVYNEKYQLIIPFEYDSLDIIDKNTILVSKNNQKGIINQNNQIIVPLECKNIEVILSSFYLLTTSQSNKQKIAYYADNQLIISDYHYLSTIASSSNLKIENGKRSQKESKIILVEKNSLNGIIEISN